MTHFGRTWWGQRFIAALEQFTDPGRLGRGRSYARSGKILDYTLADGRVTARVRGSINPYFAVYKEPIYRTSVALAPRCNKPCGSIPLESAAGPCSRRPISAPTSSRVPCASTSRQLGLSCIAKIGWG